MEAVRSAQKIYVAKMNHLKLVCLLVSLIFILKTASCKKFTDENKPEWAKKDIRDFNDADLERLLEQWEVISPMIVNVIKN